MKESRVERNRQKRERQNQKTVITLTIVNAITAILNFLKALFS